MTGAMARVSIPLGQAYRLLNHGPATLVGSRADGRANLMAAQWVMPIDFDPPKLAIVVDRATHTRALIDRSGVLTVSVPEHAQAALVWKLGSTSGAEVDKLSSVDTFAGDVVDAPLVAGCLGWLECKVARSSALDDVARELDLLIAEVVAASADDRCWQDGRFVLGPMRTLHHLGSGRFVASGEPVDGRGA